MNVHFFPLKSELCSCHTNLEICHLFKLGDFFFPSHLKDYPPIDSALSHDPSIPWFSFGAMYLLPIKALLWSLHMVYDFYYTL